jgi:hypothetical protein
MTGKEAKERLKKLRERQRERIAEWRRKNPEKARALYKKAAQARKEKHEELRRLAGESS